MYKIIGLQNIGDQYTDTPHSIGGQILKLIYKKNINIFSDIFFDKRKKAEISTAIIKNKNIEFIFPHTFMNLSGQVLNQENLEKNLEKTIIIHDDINLPFGKIKIVFNRNDGGHNGVKNIIQKLNSKKFIRIKIGVCPLDFLGKCKKPSKEYLNTYLTKKK